MAPRSSRKAPAYRGIFRGIGRSRYAFFPTVGTEQKIRRISDWLRPAAGRIGPRLGIRAPRGEFLLLSSLHVKGVLIVNVGRARSILPTIAAGIGLDEASSRNFLSFTSAATISFVPASSRGARTNNIVLELDDSEMYLQPESMFRSQYHEKTSPLLTSNFEAS